MRLSALRGTAEDGTVCGTRDSIPWSMARDRLRTARGTRRLRERLLGFVTERGGRGG